MKKCGVSNGKLYPFSLPSNRYVCKVEYCAIYYNQLGHEELDFIIDEKQMLSGFGSCHYTSLSHQQYPTERFLGATNRELTMKQQTLITVI
jgi:hypothetical protein